MGENVAPAPTKRFRKGIGVLPAFVLVIATCMTILGTTAALAPAASAKTLGSGKATIPGFIGYVTSGGRELGIGHIASGKKYGICIDTGAAYPWPSGATEINKSSAKVAYVLDNYMGAAKGSPIVAAALWWAVGKSFGANTQQSNMQDNINALEREDPDNYKKIEAEKDTIVDDANRNAGPYSTSAFNLVRGSAGHGQLKGIGVKSGSGKYVSGYDYTITLTNATFDGSGKAKATGSTLTSAHTLNFTQSDPSKSVKASITVKDLDTSTYQSWHGANGTQHVLSWSGQYNKSDSDTLAADPAYARLKKVNTTNTNAVLKGAQYQVWGEVDGNKTLNSDENAQTLTTGSDGYTPWFTYFKESDAEVCFKETKAPGGFTLSKTVQCVEPSADKASSATVTAKDAPVVAAPVFVPLTVQKSAENGDPNGVVGVTVETHQDSPTGSVIDTHTFTQADINSTTGIGSFTFPDNYSTDHTYWVVISAEPKGWLPEETQVEADIDDPAKPTVFAASLADDKIWQPALVTQVNSQSAQVGDTIQDTVSVSSTGGHTVSGTFTLLGPVEPTASGCPAAGTSAWSTAPVALTGDFQSAGDGTVQVGDYRIVKTGCYTYTESLSAAANGHTSAVSPTPAGTPSETTIVKSTPTFSTQINNQQIGLGGVLYDNVKVIGTNGSAITGDWRLLGPVATTDDKCPASTDAAWINARKAAAGTFTAAGDGIVKVGKYTVKDEGCYTYQERLAVSSTTEATDWHQVGLSIETSVANHIGTISVPLHPQIPAGGAEAGYGTGSGPNWGLLGLAGGLSLLGAGSVTVLVARRRRSTH